MADDALTLRVLKAFKELGVQIAIDDFGTGHSSLGRLKSFPVDTLKIDRLFVQGAPTDQRDAAIVQATVALGHSLGLKVIAEGVETQEQMDFVVGVGCDEVQGFVLGRPVTAAEVEVRLAKFGRGGKGKEGRKNGKSRALEV
jgi:EAL domain-containing protein (putative c-di-GMP-specific phosphodiesterase class I)